MTRILVLSVFFAPFLAVPTLADDAQRNETAAPPAEGEKSELSEADQYYARALALYQQRDFRKAVAEFTSAIRREPKRAALFVGRGKAHQGNGDLRRAFADFDLALRLDAKS